MANTPLPTKYYVADFETTVYEGQASTEVWAAALVELNTESVNITGSIDSFFNHLFAISDNEKCHMIVYFHNLRFDGAFIIYYFLQHPKEFTHAVNQDTKRFLDYRDLRNHAFTYIVSRQGQWYTITLKHHGRKIEFRDSAKLLPFSVKQLGDSFGTKHRKLSMEYEGYRQPEGVITDDEKRYIINDVLVVKEALEIMFAEGNTRLTIGACCLAQFKKLYDKDLYNQLFPNVYNIQISPDEYGSSTVGDFIHRSYHGAWCYLVKGKENHVYHNGCTYDVNSLYPYVMHSDSGFAYPIGEPTFWTGDYIPDEAKTPSHYYFVWFKSRFKLKEGMLPTIQIKNGLYPPKEWLETSNLIRHGQEYSEYEDIYGNLIQCIPEFVMTQWDWRLMHKHYYMWDTEILGGCWFQSALGLFDKYIDYYKEIKMNNKGAKRTEAKLFSNNLYGKMAASPDSSYKIAYIGEDQTIKYKDVEAHEKTPGYIPVGTAVTSHARFYTITHAQQNYHGVDKPGFIYADTDSLHGDMPPEEWVNIEQHPTKYGCWKCESEWDDATFVMPKTYIEHVIRSDGEKVRPHYSVTAAGMPKECKAYLQRSMDGIKVAKKEKKTLSKDVCKFINTPRTIADFHAGLVIPGALKAKSFPGGVLLVARNHTVR